MATQCGSVGSNSDVLSATKFIYQHLNKSLNGQPPRAQDIDEMTLEGDLLHFISKVEGQGNYYHMRV